MHALLHTYEEFYKLYETVINLVDNDKWEIVVLEVI